MPKLNEYIKVGFCSGYGDGDWSVDDCIADFSQEKMNELMNTMFHASRCAWDMWMRAEEERQRLQSATNSIKGGD